VRHTFQLHPDIGC